MPSVPPVPPVLAFDVRFESELNSNVVADSTEVIRDAYSPAMPVGVLPGALVIRFSPSRADRVLDRAQAAHEESGRWELSVFADVTRATENSEDLLARLLAAAKLHGIVLQNNKYYWRCTHAAELLGLGFTFAKGGTPDERPEHWNVELGDSPTIDDVRRFLEPFTQYRRPVMDERMDM